MDNNVKFTRECQKCHGIVEHVSEKNRDYALYKNTNCRSCSAKNRRSKNDEYTRTCSKCGYVTKYVSFEAMRKAELKKSSCKACKCKRTKSEWHKKNPGVFAKEKNPFYGKMHTDSTKDIIARKRMGQHNSVKTQFQKGEPSRNYKSFYLCWVERYGKDEADTRLEKFRQAQRNAHSGTKNNMYGKPAPNGAGNGWSGWYKGWFFRSIHELSYMVNHIEKNGWLWVSAEKKELTIPYTDWKGAQRTYRADFVINGNILVECKPKKLHNSIGVKSKSEAARMFCEERGWTFEIVAPDMLSVEQVKLMLSSGLVTMMESKIGKFKEKYGV